jgi:pimeloyl-ACP methyl ester carboxylesterase
MENALRVLWAEDAVERPRASSIPDLLPCARVAFQFPGVGRIAEYQGGRPGRAPVVLGHSLRLGASAAEVRPFFESLADERPVVAVDLPGFGSSERNPPRLHRDVYADVLAEVLDRASFRHGAAPHVVALGLGAELAAAAALLAPHPVASMTLVSPTGFSAGAEAESRVEAAQRAAGRLRWLHAPAIGGVVHALLRTRIALRRDLAQRFVGRVDAELLEATIACAQHPRARHVPLAVLAGGLHDAEVRTRIYERLRCPVLVIYDRDPDVGFEELRPFAAQRRGWRLARIRPSRGLPHFERRELTMASLTRFLEHVERPSSSPTSSLPAGDRVFPGA